MSGTVRRARWSLPLLLVLLVPRPGARAANPEPSAGIFDYDAAAPLNLEELSQEEEPDGILHDLTYLSPKGGRVTAYLVVPNRKGPFAGVVFQHWGFGDRREFLGEALRLARSGAASLLVDAPWARPEPWRHVGEGQVSEPEKDRELYVQTIVDLRRGIDLLVGRPDIVPRGSPSSATATAPPGEGRWPEWRSGSKPMS